MNKSKTEIIDHKKLDQLRNWQGRPSPELFQKVVRLFLEQMHHLLEQILQAAEQGHSEVVLEVAHTLKSSSGTVGAVNLMELCAQLELSCEQKQLDLALIDLVQHACDGVEEALKTELGLFN